MSMIVTRSQRVRTPTHHVRLRDDLAIAAAYPVGGRLALVGASEPYAVESGAGLDVGLTRDGMGAGSTTQHSSAYRLHPVADQTNTVWERPRSQVSALVYFVRYGNAAGNSILMSNGSPNTYPYNAYAIFDLGGTGRIALAGAAGGTGVLEFATADPVANHVPHVAILTYDGAVFRGWVDGVQIGYLSATGDITYPTDRGPSVGNYYDYPGNRAFQGRIMLAAVHDRAWTQGQVEALSRNPRLVFAPSRRVVHFAAAGGVYDVALSESASASDSLGAAGALTSALAEAASAADVVSAAAAFAAAMSEVATATDGTAAVSVVLGALTEGGTGVDTLTSTISGAGVYDVALLESATTADAETAGGVFYVSVSEQGVGSEALSTGGVFYVTLADSGTGTDVLSGHLPTSFSAALSESVSALDVMVSTIPSAGTLWTAMDTAAASGWTAVATTTNTWTIVPTT